MPTAKVYLDDAYLATLSAVVERIEPATETTGPGIVCDRSNFYAAGGGQPGDTGVIETADGRRIPVSATVPSPDRRDVVMLVEADGAELPAPGETVVLRIDWERRHRLMRMHTALHLLTVVCPYPVTGAAVGEDEGRIDFDMPDASPDKAGTTRALLDLVAANHPVFARQISDAELDANPGLVKSANVKPPRGTGAIRLVCIGEESAVDAQPCGGTHVRETAEIGEIHVGKIEKKGKGNRRVRVRFGPPPAA